MKTKPITKPNKISYDEYYGLSFRPEYLDNRSKILMNMINRFLTKNKKYVPIFLFSGVSGSTAMNSFIRIYGNKPYIALLIKKNKEQTHRTNVEVVTKNCPEGHDKFFYIFLDDVIDSGKTLKNCIKTINNKNNIKWLFSLIKIENISTKYKFYFMYDKFDANEDEIYDFKPLKKYK